MKKHNSMEGQIYTPLKFNVEPENESLEKEIPIGNHHFLGSMLNLGRVNGWPPGSMIHESFVSLFPLEGPRLGASQVHWPNRTSEVGVFDVGDLKLQVMVKIKEATNS